MILVSEFIKQQAQTLYQHLYREHYRTNGGTPATRVTFDHNSFRPKFNTRMRVGAPRIQWTHQVQQQVWASIESPDSNIFDPSNPNHIQHMTAHIVR